jgi:hypothetical protein
MRKTFLYAPLKTFGSEIPLGSTTKTQQLTLWANDLLRTSITLETLIR